MIVKNLKRTSRRPPSARPTSPHGFDQAMEAARLIKSWGVAPKIAMILGSGLDEVVTRLEIKATIPYAKIPHFPLPAVRGHQGSLHFGKWNGVPIGILSGRVHGYEGHSPDAVVFPVRALALAGVETFILTCAAGGISPKLKPGDFMVFRDHLNLQGSNPLAGPHDPRWGTQSCDMTAPAAPCCALQHGTPPANCASAVSRASTLLSPARVTKHLPKSGH